MTNVAGTGPDTETLQVIVGDVFSGLLGDVEPPEPDAESGAPLAVHAKVTVTGEWNGHVLVECSAPLARQVTAHLLLTTAEELADDDVRDVVGELVNVIGGNVKSVMPGPSTLSLPSSSLAGEHHLDSDGSDAAAAVQFAWRQEPLRVSVFTQEAGPGPE